jgi:transposase
MKFVATKSAEQLDLQALHRVRERLVGQRTGIINQIRAFLLERGIAVRQRLRFLRAELPGILATCTDVLSPRMLRVIEDLAGDWPARCAHRGSLRRDRGVGPSTTSDMAR